MAELIPLEHLPLHQQIESLRHHVLMFTGYALFMAEKMGLSPAAATELFMLPLTLSAQTVTVENQARSDALRMSMIHGSENVRLIHDGESWLIQIQIAADQPILEQWGTPITYWADWLGRQAELFGKPKGIHYQVSLESETLNLQLSHIP